MNTPLMKNLHQNTSPWAWQLAPGQATTLQAQATPRWLRVEDGCVWVTRRESVDQADDIWLRAGESLALPEGSEWVLEAWPQARLSLLLQAPAPPSHGRRGALLAPWWQPSWLRTSVLHA